MNTTARFDLKMNADEKAIVAKAAQRMGGRIWAESAPGQGATFYLELPR